MTKEEAVNTADKNKYTILEVEIDTENYFIVSGDEAPSGGWKGNHIFAAQIGKGTKVDRLADLKSDLISVYGNKSESYKKIVFPL